MLRISSDLNNGLYFYLFPVKHWETSILRRFLRFLYLFKSVDLLILLNKIGLIIMNSTANSNAQIPQFDSSSAIMNTQRPYQLEQLQKLKEPQRLQYGASVALQNSPDPSTKPASNPGREPNPSQVDYRCQKLSDENLTLYDLQAVIKREESEEFKGTNRVLAKEYKDCFCFALPAYVRLGTHGIADINISNGSASMIAILLVSIYFGDLPQELVEDLEKLLMIRVNNQINYNLTQSQFQKTQGSLKVIVNKKTKIMTFIVRVNLPLELESQPTLVPFDLIHLKLSIKLPTVVTAFLGKQAFIDFNIMYAFKDDQDKKNQEDYHFQPKRTVDYQRLFDTSGCRDINEYGLVHRSQQMDSRSKYSSFRITSSYYDIKDQDQGIKSKEIVQSNIVNSSFWNEEFIDTVKSWRRDKSNKQKQFLLDMRLLKGQLIYLTPRQCRFQKSQQENMPSTELIFWDTANFSLTLYRHPSTFILMVFLPIILLSIFTIFIFFQDKELGGRIDPLCTLLVAYAAFLPSVRQQIPPNPKLTIMDIFLYAVMFSSLLCLFSSFLLLGQEQQGYIWTEDPLLIITLAIVVVIILTMIVGTVVFKFIFEPRYKINSKKPRTFDADLKDPEKWSNIIADTHWENHFYTTQFAPFNSQQFFCDQDIFCRLWDQRVRNHDRAQKSDNNLPKELRYFYKATRIFIEEKEILNFFLKRLFEKFNLSSEMKKSKSKPINKKQEDAMQNNRKSQIVHLTQQMHKNISEVYDHYRLERKKFLNEYFFVTLNSTQKMDFRIKGEQNNLPPLKNQRVYSKGISLVAKDFILKMKI